MPLTVRRHATVDELMAAAGGFLEAREANRFATDA
jgi:hypothetical protein